MTRSDSPKEDKNLPASDEEDVFSDEEDDFSDEKDDFSELESDTDFDKMKKVIVGTVECKPSNGEKSQDRFSYAKKHFCLYCNKAFLNLARHLEFVHSTEKEVIEFSRMIPRCQERLKAVSILRNRGNFIHNLEVLRKQEGILIVTRRPMVETHATHFYPCPMCLGFYSKCELHRHRCPAGESKNKSKISLQSSKSLLLGSLGELDCDVAELLSKMRDDSIGTIAMNDHVIKLFGMTLMKKHEKGTQDRMIRERIRQISRFVDRVRNTNMGMEKAMLIDILKPCYFDVIIKAVTSLAENPGTGLRESKCLPLKLGHTIKKCLDLLKGQAIRWQDKTLQKEVEDLKYLMESEWADKVSSKQLKRIYHAKLNRIEVIPTTEEVKKFMTGLSLEFEDAFAAAQRNQTVSNGRRLAKVILAQIIAFNKRRAGETAKTEISDFESLKNADQVNEEIFASFSEQDRQVAKSHYLIHIKRKRGRHVPIILTESMKVACEFLLKNRVAFGNLSENIYLFASPGRMGYISTACKIMKDFNNQFQTKNVTSTGLRKHLATSIQSLNLQDGEQDSVACHLGHDIRVHRGFYRKQDRAIELGTIAKLLHASEHGKIHTNKGKTLAELTVQEALQVQFGHEIEEDEDEIEGSQSAMEDEFDENYIEKTRI